MEHSRDANMAEKVSPESSMFFGLKPSRANQLREAYWAAHAEAPSERFWNLMAIKLEEIERRER